jgi:chromosome segregation protein
MHIKALEICGFKSFVDRTIIHFDHDVVGIVGPNGCGKSNIVDAIRWCMGEQSAKNLRGRAMEDVIFNGSELRGPHGFAEVTLVFDNSDTSETIDLPDEWRHVPEVAVTRRLYRDGTSEYLLNKSQVRLRDITDLFLGTGVGTKAYSIVEQGRIGQIVSARAEDRRVFIEEAAGITKYKQRRKQAERKIELTQQNLLRVSDIVSELERNRNSLKRQVAKAERFLEYRSELEDLVLHEASHQYLEFVVLSKVYAETYETQQKASGELRTQLDVLETGLEDDRVRAGELELNADELARAAFEADNEVTSLQADMERCRDRLAHLTDKLAASDSERQEIDERIARARHEEESITLRLTELGRDQEAREADAVTEIEGLEALRIEESHATESVNTLRQRVHEARNQAIAAETRRDGMMARCRDAQQSRERLATEQETVIAELGELIARRGALETSVAALAEGKRLSATEKEQIDFEVKDLRGRLLDSEKSVDIAKNELGIKRNRLRALEELHRKHEGVGAGTRALLSFGDPTVLGLVADKIEAPAEMQSAVAGLLGDRLQYVVVSDISRGLELLARLRSEKRGRAHVISARPTYVAGNQPSLPNVTGVVGLLVDNLRFAPEDEALARALIGGAVVVEDTATAIALSHQCPELTIVTKDGTVVRPEGVISGGTGDDVAAHMVEQKRELRVLGEEVARLETTYAEVAENHAQLRARLAESTAALDRARQEAHEGELAHVSAEKDLTRTSEQIERLEHRHDVIDIDLQELDRRLSENNAAIEACTLQLDELKANGSHLEAEMSGADQLAAEWRERVSAQSAMVTERKVRLAQVREQVEAARASLERTSQSLADLDQRSHRLAVEGDEAAAAFGETAARLMLSREGRDSAHGRARDAHESLEVARTDLDTTRQALAERDHSLRGIREALESHDAESRKAEMALTRVQIEHEHLLQNVREKFRGLNLATVIGDYHRRPIPDADQRRRIEELTNLIDRMGPVNLDAKSEYTDAETRFLDLNQQRLDLQNALADLEKAIKMMNKESRKRFKESFDAINETFKKTFVRMFRGGRAELQLTNPEDLLASGVDIIAQPPGKKLGNIELMSGGEKALTATSLIFSIFQYKPSPFCILDEVDAPLDEANVARYNEAIRAMTDRSQFILITHIRKTMQSVDVLYGVTMGEPGVSRIVSVKVNEQAAVRSEARAPNTLQANSTAAAEDTAAEETNEVAVA